MYFFTWFLMHVSLCQYDIGTTIANRGYCQSAFAALFKLLHLTPAYSTHFDVHGGASKDWR